MFLYIHVCCVFHCDGCECGCVCIWKREGKISHPCVWHAGCPTKLLTPISFYISEGLAEIEVIIYTESFTSCSLNVLSLTDLHLQFYPPKGYSLVLTWHHISSLILKEMSIYLFGVNQTYQAFWIIYNFCSIWGCYLRVGNNVTC